MNDCKTLPWVSDLTNLLQDSTPPTTTNTTSNNTTTNYTTTTIATRIPTTIDTKLLQRRLGRRSRRRQKHQPTFFLEATSHLFHCDKEDGLTLKYKIPKIHIASKCRNSSRIYYDTKMLDEKEMPEFLIVESLKNARKSCQKIRAAVLVSEQTDRSSGKWWWKLEKVSILLETRWSGQTLVPSSHSRSFRKSLFWKCSHRSCIARQFTVTKGLHFVCLSHRKRKRI